MIDSIGLNDKLTIQVIRDGTVVQEMTPISDTGFLGKILDFLGLKKYTTDLITTVGIQGMTTHLSADYGYIGYGTGTTEPARADTALETEVDRKVAVVTRTTTTLTNDTVNFLVTFDITGTHAITEAVIISASTGGNVLARQTFAVVNLVNGDQLVFNWDIVLA